MVAVVGSGRKDTKFIKSFYVQPMCHVQHTHAIAPGLNTLQ